MITKDLREKMKVIILAIFIISFVTASPLVQEEDTEQLLREKRAIGGETDTEAKEPGQLSCGELKCGKGKYAKITKDDKGEFKSLECVPCPAGEISKKKGLPLGCTPCQGGASSPDGSKCSAPCKKGQGWNEEKSKCDKCEPGTYNDEEVGVNPCKPCPTKFHESKKGSASCLMNCPAGFEPNEDGTSCRACKYGTFNNKAGKRGKNRQCMSCCGVEGSECPKNWTLTTGADSKQHCFKLHPKQNDCFKGLVEALRKISMKMNKDDNEDMRFRKAFCRSKLNLEELRVHYAKCGERTVKTSDETEQKLHPKMKSEDGKELSLDRLFDSETEMSCDMMDDGEDVGEHSGDSEPPSGIVEGEWDHQNDGDRKPPVDGGKPKDGDGKQEEGGDQKPPEGGDQKPPEGGDQKPPVGGSRN